MASSTNLGTRLKRIFFTREAPVAMLLSAVMLTLFAGALEHRRQRLAALEPVAEPIRVFPDFGSYAEVDAKKQMFLDFMELYIDRQNERVLQTRQRLLVLSEVVAGGATLSDDDNADLIEIADRYFLDHGEMSVPDVLQELLKRVDTIPTALALAQAANESAWGTSRFTIEANNIFGQWCYDEGCGLVPLRRRANASHEVRAFDSVEAAVRAYFMNLNTHDQYENFREMRHQMRIQRGRLDPLVLAYGLEGYSERGQHYVDLVQTIIKQNNLVEKYSS